VATLFVALGEQRWGTIAADSGAITWHDRQQPPGSHTPARWDGRVCRLSLRERTFFRSAKGDTLNQRGYQDLLDLAAVETFLKGGTIYATPPAQVPGNGPMAALLRY
jgi:hypothetical protein